MCASFLIACENMVTCVAGLLGSACVSRVIYVVLGKVASVMDCKVIK